MTVIDPESLSLIKRAAGGDSGAFASLFDQHYNAVYNYVLWLSGDPDLAEDVTQDTFIRAHRSLPQLRPPFNLKAWLCRTAHNLFVNETKRKGPVVPLDSDTRLKAVTRDPERELLFAELSGPVRTALTRLSPNHREALVLREVEGFEYADIAEIMGVSLDNVKVLLHRARSSFKGHYRHPLLSEDGLPECEVLQELLDAAHDGNVTPDQDATIKQHVADCVTCQKRKQALAFLLTLFANQHQLKPPDAFRDRVHAQLQQLGKPGGKAVAKSVWVAGVIAIAAIAAIAWAVLGPPSLVSSSGSGGDPAGAPTATSGSNPIVSPPLGSPTASSVPETCQTGWLPASGCFCCGTTLTCADGNLGEFNPACSGGDACGSATCGDGNCDAACGEEFANCPADCHL